MSKETYLQKIVVAHKELNRLLLGAYQFNLEYNLAINQFTATKDDKRTVIGLDVFEKQRMYHDDGDA